MNTSETLRVPQVAARPTVKGFSLRTMTDFSDLLTLSERLTVAVGRWSKTLSPKFKHDILRLVYVNRFNQG